MWKPGVQVVIGIVLLTGIAATPGTVFFKQGNNGYEFKIPEASGLGGSAFEVEAKAVEDEALENGNVEKVLDALKGSEPESESDLDGSPSGKLESFNEAFNSEEKRPTKEKKRHREPLPFCRNLKWPLVTSSNPVPCITDAGFRVDDAPPRGRFGRGGSGQGQGQGSYYLSAHPRLLPRPISPPISGRIQARIAPQLFEANFIQRRHYNYNDEGDMPNMSGWGETQPATPALSNGWGQPEPQTPAPSGWGQPEPQTTPAPSNGWGQPEPQTTPASSGWGQPEPQTTPAPSNGWGQPEPQTTPAPSNGWGQPEPQTTLAPSGWSSGSGGQTGQRAWSWARGQTPGAKTSAGWRQEAPPATASQGWSSSSSIGKSYNHWGRTLLGRQGWSGQQPQGPAGQGGYRGFKTEGWSTPDPASNGWSQPATSPPQVRNGWTQNQEARKPHYNQVARNQGWSQTQTSKPASSGWGQSEPQTTPAPIGWGQPEPQTTPAPSGWGQTTPAPSNGWSQGQSGPSAPPSVQRSGGWSSDGQGVRKPKYYFNHPQSQARWPHARAESPSNGWGSSEPQTTPAPSGWGQSEPQTTPAPSGWGQSEPQTTPAPSGWGQSEPQTTPAPSGWGQSEPQTTPASNGWGQPESQTTPAPSGWGQSEPQTTPAPNNGWAQEESKPEEGPPQQSGWAPPPDQGPSSPPPQGGDNGWQQGQGGPSPPPSRFQNRPPPSFGHSSMSVFTPTRPPSHQSGRGQQSPPPDFGRELERYRKLVAVLLRRLHTQSVSSPTILPRPISPLQGPDETQGQIPMSGAVHKNPNQNQNYGPLPPHQGSSNYGPPPPGESGDFQQPPPPGNAGPPPNQDNFGPPPQHGPPNPSGGNGNLQPQYPVLQGPPPGADFRNGKTYTNQPPPYYSGPPNYGGYQSQQQGYGPPPPNYQRNRNQGYSEGGSDSVSAQIEPNEPPPGGWGPGPQGGRLPPNFQPSVQFQHESSTNVVPIATETESEANTQDFTNTTIAGPATPSSALQSSAFGLGAESSSNPTALIIFPVLPQGSKDNGTTSSVSVSATITAKEEGDLVEHFVQSMTLDELEASVLGDSKK